MSMGEFSSDVDAGNTWMHPWEKAAAAEGALEALDIPIVGDDNLETVVEDEPPKVEHRAESALTQQAENSLKAKHKEAALIGQITDKRGEEFFDIKAAKASRVCLVGDSGQSDFIDTAVYQIVETAAEKVQAEKGGGIIIAARLTPAASTQIVKQANDPANPTAYKAMEVGVTEPDGLYSVLTSEQTAEAVASAASGGNERVAAAYAGILSRVTKALETQNENKNTGEITTIPPSLEMVRDAVRWLRDDLTTNIKLTRDQRTAVDDALPETMRKQNELHYEPLGQWLDKAIPDTPPPTQQLEQTNQENDNTTTPPPDEVTVFNIALPTRAHGMQLKMQEELLSYALVPLLAEQTPWGRPEMIVVTDADQADPAALKEISRLCETQNIPLVVSLGSLTTPGAVEVAASADLYGITKNNTPQAQALSSILGLTTNEDVTGISNSRSGTEGTGVHTSDSKNFRLGVYAEGTGTSESGDLTQGVSYSTGENIAINEGPRFRAAEINAIPRGKIALVDSNGHSYGLYGITDRERMGDFPLTPRRKPQIDAKGPLDRLEAQHNSAAALMAKKAQQTGALPPGAAGDTTNKPTYGDVLALPPGVPPVQRLQELRIQYSLRSSSDAKMNFDTWCKSLWVKESTTNPENATSWEEFQIRNGLRRPRGTWW